MKDAIVVASFRTRLEAETAAGLLEEAGIPYLVQSSEGMGYGPFPSGARILVRPEQAEAARTVLGEAAAEDEEP